MRRLFFHEESIHEVSRRYLEHEYIHTNIHTYIHTYGQAETNMSPTFLGQKHGRIKIRNKKVVLLSSMYLNYYPFYTNRTGKTNVVKSANRVHRVKHTQQQLQIKMIETT